jgi:hypothetical protein
MVEGKNHTEFWVCTLCNNGDKKCDRARIRSYDSGFFVFFFCQSISLVEGKNHTEFWVCTLSNNEDKNMGPGQDSNPRRLVFSFFFFRQSYSMVEGKNHTEFWVCTLSNNGDKIMGPGQDSNPRRLDFSFVSFAKVIQWLRVKITPSFGSVPFVKTEIKM